MTDEQIVAAMIKAIIESSTRFTAIQHLHVALAAAKPLIAAEAREAARIEAVAARPQGCICPRDASLLCENPFCPRKNPLRLAT